MTSILAWILVGNALAIDARPGGPYSLYAESTVLLDASSTHTDDQCDWDQFWDSPPHGQWGVIYRWDLDNDGVWDMDWGDLSQITYSSAGVDGPAYPEVRLAVGCWGKEFDWGTFNFEWYIRDDVEEIGISVLNVAPAFTSVQWPAGGSAGQALSFSASASDVEAADTLTYLWVFGDGQEASGASVTHAYSAGTWYPTVTVSDDDGGTDYRDAAVDIASVPVEIITVDWPGGLSEGDLAEFSVETNSTDGGFTITWTIDGVVQYGDAVSHTFTDDGLYDATVSVTDGYSTAERSTTITVQNVAPTVPDITYAEPVIEGIAVALSASVEDPGDDPLTWIWYVNGVVQWNVGASGTFTWTPADDGSYTVKAVVDDGDGGEGFREESVVVINANPTISGVEVFGGFEGQTFTATALASDVAADTLIYDWVWPVGSSAGNPGSWVPIQDGVYTGHLTVSDEDGGESTTMFDINVANVPPIIDITSVPDVVDEGDTVNLFASATDVVGDTLTYSWVLPGNGTVSGASASGVLYDSGLQTITLNVSDGTSTASQDFEITVNNLDPMLTNVGVPLNVDEGASVALTATATDPGADTLTYTWDVGVLGTAVGADIDVVFGDNGTWPVDLTVTDGEGGEDTWSGSITVNNVAPSVSISGDVDDSLSTTLSWTAVVTDPGADTHTWSWDFGDGFTSAGAASQSHTYVRNGLFEVIAKATDDDGAKGQGSIWVTISSLGPTVEPFAFEPSAPTEGQGVDFDCVGVDVGLTGTLLYAWDFGDGGSDTGSSVSHSFADDGQYQVVCVVEDGSGQTSQTSAVVEVSNVAPVLTGTPPTESIEGELYTFNPGVDDPGADTHTWQGAGPTGVAVDPDSGAVTWTPTYDQLGPASLELTVSDEAASDDMSWTVTVLVRDMDGDGMADTWEDQVGLNPDDATDAQADPDGDGRTNLDEFVIGSDPFSDDGPAVPVLASPIGGEEVPHPIPTLVVDNVVSDVEITYSFVIYDSAQLSTVVASGMVAEDPSGSTGWPEPVPLTENETYWWTAQALDPYTVSAWAVAESFRVNAVNEAPSAPVVLAPLDGASIALLMPTIRYTASSDPDGDQVEYTIAVLDAALDEVGRVPGLFDDGSEVAWTISWNLTEEREFCTVAWAVDEHGLESSFSAITCFWVDTDDESPSEPVIVAPSLEETVTSLNPTVTVDNGVDPESRGTWHTFVVDSDPLFGSADEQSIEKASGNGQTSWIIDNPLREDTWYSVRALCSDGNTDSQWATSSFFVSVENHPPTVPVLFNPPDEAVIGEADELVVVNSIDPEGGSVTYDFQVWGDGTLVIDALDVAGDESGYTGWFAGELDPGDYTWTARALDSDGLASEWSGERGFSVAGPTGDNDRELGGPEDVDGGGDNGPTACGCAVGGGAGWMAVLVGLVGFRRRRRSRSVAAAAFRRPTAATSNSVGTTVPPSCAALVD